MREIPKEKFDRLPRWAQDEVRSLQSEIRDLTSQLRAFNGETESDFTVHGGIGEETLNIPRHWYACFKIGDQRVRVSARKDRLRIDGDRGILVRPSGGVNVVEILTCDLH